MSDWLPRLFIRDMTPTPFAVVFMIAIWLAVIGFWIGVGYIAVHFAMKYW
jgi:hypothetical protein